MQHTIQLCFDADTLEAVYIEASAKQMSDRWRNALDRAYDLLMASGSITVELGKAGTIQVAHIPSQSGNGVYAVNGTCDCRAGLHGHSCAHRAAKRLLENAYDRARKSAPVAGAAPLLRPSRLNDDLFKDESLDPQYGGVTREQAYADMAECFPD